MSRHDRVVKQQARPSPYCAQLVAYETDPAEVVPPPVEPTARQARTIEVTFSELAAFLDCAMAYRLRNLVGSQPRLAPELGYGKAVHHVLRTIADETKAHGEVPGPGQIDAILDSGFFLATASKPAHRQLKAARRLVAGYASDHADDLYRVWEAVRPFELHLDGITVNGRADVILDHEGGVPTALAILDYKTSTREWSAHALQLQVYADAGRREGLYVRGAYVHDLKAGSRADVDVTAAAVEGAEVVILGAADRLRARDYAPSPGSQCRRCEVRTVCQAAKR